MMKNILKWKFYLSTILMVVTATVIITGILLFFAQPGPSPIFGIDKHLVESLHKAGGILMSLTLIFHIWLNYPLYKSEMLHVTKEVKK